MQWRQGSELTWGHGRSVETAKTLQNKPMLAIHYAAN
jgi:hypothetical protein